MNSVAALHTAAGRVGCWALLQCPLSGLRLTLNPDPDPDAAPPWARSSGEEDAVEQAKWERMDSHVSAQGWAVIQVRVCVCVCVCGANYAVCPVPWDATPLKQGVKGASLAVPLE